MEAVDLQKRSRMLFMSIPALSKRRLTMTGESGGDLNLYAKSAQCPLIGLDQ